MSVVLQALTICRKTRCVFLLNWGIPLIRRHGTRVRQMPWMKMMLCAGAVVRLTQEPGDLSVFVKLSSKGLYCSCCLNAVNIFAATAT
jgi:hypothetical protein